VISVDSPSRDEIEVAPRIGFQGEHGAYSEEAIFKHFGRDAVTVPVVSIHDVFRLTEAGGLDLGVVPIENSVEGSINETYDMLISSDLSVMGEIVLRVVHCLIALPSARLSGIREVYSHPQALAQCRNFVRSLGATPIVTYDTAGSAKMIKERRLKASAAIAGERAAKIYGLKVLKRGIEDYSTNSTRFLIVSKKTRSRAPRPHSKTSLIVSLSHTPGSLYHALEAFASADVNLTKIESRPTKERPWEYYFILDFEGHRDDTNVKKMLAELRERTSFMKVLGSYPRSKAEPS
jgi:prephenate dehydratase